MSFRLAVALICVSTSAACLKAPPFQGIERDGGSDDGDGDATDSGVLAQWGYLKAEAPAPGDHFGTSIAISSSGTTLAVGTPENDEGAADAGAVDVFVSTADGWVHQYRASGTAAGDAFGTTIALSANGDTLAIGAPGYTTAAVVVYLFTRSGSNWSVMGYVQPTLFNSGDAFGTSIALSSDGNTMVVGAPGEDATGADPNDNGATDAGAAYVFQHNTTWSQSAYLKASNAQSLDGFGNSVAISGDGATVVVGAALEDSGSQGINTTPDESATASGAAYVYRFAGNWNEDAYIKPSNTSLNWAFGSAVALSSDGNMLVVGALGDGSGGSGVDADQFAGSSPRSGAAFVFERTATWSQSAFIKAPAPGTNDYFGGAVAVSRDGARILIGAKGESSAATGIDGDPTDNSEANAGAAYLLDKDTQWHYAAYIKASNTESSDNFGTSAALADTGSTLAIGATDEDSSSTDPTLNDAMNAGAVYVFHVP